MTYYSQARRRDWTPRVYKSQVTMRPVDGDHNHMVLWSIPHQLHRAVIQGTPGGRFRVSFPTVPGRGALSYNTREEALRAAADIVSRKAGADLRMHSGEQRTAMGQGRCPKLTSGRICNQAPEVGTVWCAWHPYGGERDV